MSHSGGMLFLPDSTEIVEKKYKDFNLKAYNYSYTDFSIEQKFFKCIEKETQSFVNTLYYHISTLNNNNIINPFIWCDFFTNITEKQICHSLGRLRLMNIITTPVLKILLSILKINYNLNTVNNMTIFRGHEHESRCVQKCFLKNNIYKVNDQKSNINFVHLAPAWLDNYYVKWIIKGWPDNIPTIQMCMMLEPNEILETKELTKLKTEVQAIEIVEEEAIISDKTKKKEESIDQRLFMCLGLVLPFVFMNIKKSGICNIVTGIGSSELLLLLVHLLSKNNNRFFYNFLLIFLPFCSSMTCVVLNNINYIHIFQNIWQYVSFTALKDNYLFFKN